MHFINNFQVVRPFVIDEQIYTLVKTQKTAKIKTFYILFYVSKLLYNVQVNTLQIKINIQL